MPPPELEGIELRPDRESGVCLLELNVPGKLNAISGAMLDGLSRALEWVSRSDQRCLLLTGAGGVFSAGADLQSYLSEVDVTRPQTADDFLDRWVAVFGAIGELELPTVAAIGGVAYGGALNLALACDLVMVGRGAKLCEPYVKLAASADVAASWMLPQLVGLAQARRLIMTGETIDGQDAHAIGLVAYVVDDDALVTESRALAAKVAALDPAAVTANKRLLRREQPETLAAALEREKRSNRERVASEGFAAALARFR